MDWFFGRSTPFQVDANMGLTAAIYEMLVQSTPNIIKLLPALPPELSSGKLNGMCTRAGVTVDMEWQLEPFAIEAHFSSRRDQTVTVQLPQSILDGLGLAKGAGQSLDIELKAGTTIVWSWNPNRRKFESTL